MIINKNEIKAIAFIVRKIVKYDYNGRSRTKKYGYRDWSINPLTRKTVNIIE